MTEKRFTGEFDKQYSGVHDNGEQLTNFEVVDLLNNLSEDNDYLEKRFKEEEWHYDHIDEDRDVWKYKCQELEKENEQLKRVIAENEKLIQSTYDELTKLRCIKKNLGRIKVQWDWIMEAIQYD